MIVVINAKKALLEHAGEALAKATKGAARRPEYDFSKSLFKRMWDVIIKFSQNLRKRNFKNYNSNNNLNDFNKNNNTEIFESIKIFTLNRNLEYSCSVTEALTEESAQKLYLPLLRKCLSFSPEAQECDLSHSLSQLLTAMHSNKKLFPENFKANESSFYISDADLPVKTKFYRVLFFNGAITELINSSALENKLIEMKTKFNFVFNYFLFEHDFQFEKKIYPLLLKNNMIDYKITDFELFMKQDDFNAEQQLKNQFQDFQSSIANLYGKAYSLEKQIQEFFVAFSQAKNLFFGNSSFCEYQKKYDAEHTKLMQDYEIISKNNVKYFEFAKANLNKPQIDYIRENFAEMRKKNVVGNSLLKMKSNVDFPRFNLLLIRMIEEAKSLFDALVKDSNRLLINLKEIGHNEKNKNFNFFSDYFSIKIFLQTFLV